jgi:Flp pilus assembly protein TadB
MTLQTLLLPILSAAIAMTAWIFFMRRMSNRANAPAPATVETPEKIKDKNTRSPFPLVIGLVLAGFIWVIAERPTLAIAAFVLCFGVSEMLRIRNQKKQLVLEEQYAIEAVGGASRSLRAGIPLSGMLQILAVETRGETQMAFRQIIQREAMGEELAIAIRRVLLQSPLSALRAFGLALIIQISAGGNLADTTDRLARSLVDRTRVLRRSKAIVAYARAAAIVLAVLPPIVVALMCVMVEGYSEFLFDRTEGNTILGVAVVLVVIGLTYIQRFGRIELQKKWKPT